MNNTEFMSNAVTFTGPFSLAKISSRKALNPHSAGGGVEGGHWELTSPYMYLRVPGTQPGAPRRKPRKDMLGREGRQGAGEKHGGGKSLCTGSANPRQSWAELSVNKSH